MLVTVQVLVVVVIKVTTHNMRVHPVLSQKVKMRAMTLRVTLEYATIVVVHGLTPVVRHALRVGRHVIIATSEITLHNVADHLSLRKQV